MSERINTFWDSIIQNIIPVGCSLATAVVTATIMFTRLDLRVESLEQEYAKYERNLEKEIQRFAAELQKRELDVNANRCRIADAEQRVAKMEATFAAVHGDMQEIKSGITSLLQNGHKSK